MRALMALPTRLNPSTLILIPLLMAMAGVAVIWDLQRLDEDFRGLYSLLRTARLDALYKRTTIMVLFDGNRVIASDRKNSKFTTTTVPTIARVEYDTTLGKDMRIWLAGHVGIQQKGARRGNHAEVPAGFPAIYPCQLQQGGEGRPVS